MSLEFWVALAASIGTIASAIIAIIAIKQNNINESNHYAYNFCDKLETWYRETLYILKELFYLSDVKENLSSKNALLSKLSTNIDIGRGYFRNISSTMGSNKPEIYKGKRVVPLSLLVMFHHVFEQNLNIGHYAVLRNIERAFVSEVTLYKEKIQKELKVAPYKLTDKLFILEAENINNPSLYPIYENEDIIKYIKYANMYFEKLPESVQNNLTLTTNDKILMSADFIKFMESKK